MEHKYIMNTYKNTYENIQQICSNIQQVCDKGRVGNKVSESEPTVSRVNSQYSVSRNIETVESEPTHSRVGNKQSVRIRTFRNVESEP